jgi:hypothetical protein
MLRVHGIEKEWYLDWYDGYPLKVTGKVVRFYSKHEAELVKEFYEKVSF